MAKKQKKTKKKTFFSGTIISFKEHICTFHDLLPAPNFFF